MGASAHAQNSTTNNNALAAAAPISFTIFELCRVASSSVAAWAAAFGFSTFTVFSDCDNLSGVADFSTGAGLSTFAAGFSGCTGFSIFATDFSLARQTIRAE